MEDIQKVIDEKIKSKPVLIFMKGNPSFPRCGFSAKAVSALREVGADFDHVDVLEDDNMREGIKKYTNWPTIPQVFIKGKFVGGSDIVLEMYESGELKKQLES